MRSMVTAVLASTAFGGRFPASAENENKVSAGEGTLATIVISDYLKSEIFKGRIAFFDFDVNLGEDTVDMRLTELYNMIKNFVS